VIRSVACLIALALSASLAGAQEKSRLPNVVMILVDDMGYGDVGCYGTTGWQTPHLDQMAAEGVRCTDFYVAQAICSASRSALMTGCYPNRVGIVGALGPKSTIGLSDKESTIAEVLKGRGYSTAIFGKWHLGYQSKFLPTRHGFDDYFGLPYSNDMWTRHPCKKFPPLPLFRGKKVVARDPDQSKLTTWYTERAVSFIEKNKDKPFFLYLPHTMPHVPLAVSSRFAGKSKQGLYGDVIMELDWSVGQVLAALKKHNLDEQTLVMFASDNGPWLSYGNHAGTTGGLREGKATTFEGGVRVPFIARWPGRIPAGTVCRAPAMTIDLLPTLAHLSGAELPKRPIDGRNLWPVLAGEAQASPHEALFFFLSNHLQAVRSGKWKLHFPHPYWTLAGKPAGRDGKPAKYTDAQLPLSLFDLEADPGETTNLADKHPDVVKRLTALADPIRQELGADRIASGARDPGHTAEGRDQEEEKPGWMPAPSTLLGLLFLFVMNLCVYMASPFFKNRSGTRPE
jgi:arylsulfatase A